MRRCPSSLLAVLLGHWSEKCTGCVWDLNDDAVVGPADLAELLGNWGPCHPEPYNPFCE